MRPPTIEEMQQRLDGLYHINPVLYAEQLETIKGIGYKVYRNSLGKHKIEMNLNYLNDIFGGVFGRKMNE